jgi:predicted MPP superfamily phosphohydrolase
MQEYPMFARIVEFLSDIYMRKAYQAIQTIQSPEVVFFTGDLFDGVTYNMYRERKYVSLAYVRRVCPNFHLRGRLDFEQGGVQSR